MDTNAPPVKKPARRSSRLVIILLLGLILLCCLGSLTFAWYGGYLKTGICRTVMPNSSIYNRLQCGNVLNVTNTQSQFPLVTVAPGNNNTQSDGSEQSNVESVIQNVGGGVVGIGVSASNGQEQIIGTGFLVSQGGLIVTNRHVVENEDSNYYMVFKDSSSPIQVPNTSIFRDPVNDIALIKIDQNQIPSGIKAIPVGDSDGVKLGQTVIAIGNPLGTFTGSATKGIISGLHREVSVSQGFFSNQSSSYEDVIQTDAAINPGNSGGPLLDLAGEAIGVNFATIEGASNMSFALPINRIKQRIAELEQYNKFRIPYLGVQYQTRVVFVNNRSLVGAQVASVVTGSPAAAAGIQVNDVIVEFNGKDLENNSLSNLIQSTKIGDKVDVVIIRNKQQQTLSVTIGER